jgi:hypothetical protein
MNHTHLPRSLVILIFILVVGTFVAGTLRAFVTARAAIEMDDLAQRVDLPTSTLIVEFPTPGLTPTPLPASLLPPPTDSLIPTEIPTPVDHTVYADTIGIIALAILLVVVVLIGTVLGERKPRRKKEPQI